MSGLSLTDLQCPPDEWRVDLHSAFFETAEFAAKEDAKRARMLRKRATRLTGKRRARMLALADLLDPEVTPGIPATPASARYIRQQRIRIIGAVCALAGSFCYSELGINFPSSGGEYVYLTRAYGPTWIPHRKFMSLRSRSTSLSCVPKMMRSRSCSCLLNSSFRFRSTSS